MKITVKVKPNAKQEKVERIGENNFLVWVKERPVEGAANEALIRALAGYFDIPKSGVVLVKGKTSRQKIFEVIK